MEEVREIYCKPHTQRWKLFKYLEFHMFVTSRDSKYPPLEIMDLPKLISSLEKEEIHFSKVQRERINHHGIKVRYKEYKLITPIKLKERY